MGMFSDLMGKIFGHSAQAAPAPSSPPVGMPESRVTERARQGIQPGATSTTPGTIPPVTTTGPVDVAAVLDKLAASHKEKLDWKHSIVDLMKLVGMDSSLSARKELAKDLQYTGDTNDSATMNIWLHKQVMKKLAENGGKVPADLLAH